MHSVCRCSLPVWRSFFKKGTPVTYFCPALDPPLGGSGRKTTTLVRDHKYFIHTKFHQKPSSGSGEEVENVKVYRRTTDNDDDGRTDNGALWQQLTWAFGSGELKSLNACAGNENFIPTKFHKHPSNGSVVNADCVFPIILHALVHPPSFTWINT